MKKLLLALAGFTLLGCNVINAENIGTDKPLILQEVQNDTTESNFYLIDSNHNQINIPPLSHVQLNLPITGDINFHLTDEESQHIFTYLIRNTHNTQTGKTLYIFRMNDEQQGYCDFIANDNNANLILRYSTMADDISIQEDRWIDYSYNLNTLQNSYDIITHYFYKSYNTNYLQRLCLQLAR